MLIKHDISWTLFLDRDGVINRRPMNDYVKTWDQFEFLRGVLEALRLMNTLFGKIIIVTNQQGIGKNLMTREDLEKIHMIMKSQIEKSGGHIDSIYYCPDLDTKPITCRKPGIKMAELARRDYPDILFSKSIMAGDTASDLQFGLNAGMQTVYINTNEVAVDPSLYVSEYPDLISFAKSFFAND